ncbi:MAG: 3-keto-5-aminohexanoate cleavage protein, partial [Rhodobacteraceae bacterium]|nr:3-keto-5-aminohexanoate cleavage protein [Paracoccaceae bacterium]
SLSFGAPSGRAFNWISCTMISYLPCAAGIGKDQITLNDWAVSAGGHARTGLEDNVRLDRETLAPSNAALVKRVVELCDKYERPVATWQQAREILELRPS